MSSRLDACCPAAPGSRASRPALPAATASARAPTSWAQAGGLSLVGLTVSARSLQLGKAVPVHFVYLTAFVGANGIAQFRPDIYGRDSSFGDPDDQQDAVVAQQSRAVTP